MTLDVWPGTFAIATLDSGHEPPAWSRAGVFVSITRTPDEWSIVCEAALVPPAVRAERGWRIIKVVGPLAFSLTGVLASLAVPLADARVSIFAVSTFDTDYVLVRDVDLATAVAALRGAGHDVREGVVREPAP